MTAKADEAVELYGLPLDEFISARDRTVKQLRDGGHMERAALVAKLRKPTTDAWALNQVSRRHSDLVERLTATHTALRQAADATAFRSASEARNRVLEEIIEAATSVLERDRHASTGQVRERISQTLLAAATNPGTEDDLRRGTVQRSVHISGGWDLGLALAPPTDQAETGAEQAAGKQEAERLAREVERLEATAARLRSEADRAHQALADARRQASAAEEAARAAEKEARQARKEWQSARR